MKFKVIILILVVTAFGLIKPISTQNADSCINVSNIEEKKSFKGFIKQRPMTKLSFQADGKISFLPYKKGDFVRKGEVIARLDGVLYKIKKEKFILNDEVNYNIITAPYDGYIEEINKPLNSYAKKNECVISLFPTNKTQAETLVEAQYINKINLREKAEIEYGNSIYEAKIADIVKSDDNYLIELELDDLYKELREGTNIKVKLSFN